MTLYLYKYLPLYLYLNNKLSIDVEECKILKEFFYWMHYILSCYMHAGIGQAMINIELAYTSIYLSI